MGQHGRVEEVVPGRDEAEHAGGDQRWHRHRQHDAAQHAQARAAVDHRRLLEGADT
jgi:hypothetical protein